MPQSYDDWKTDVGPWPDAEQGRPKPCLDCGRVYDWRAEPPASGLYCADCVSAHTGCVDHAPDWDPARGVWAVQCTQCHAPLEWYDDGDGLAWHATTRA